ncbi:MAG TPA: transketolase, partial [Woeseiaceae bacterium]|nr:transketolase [Woeseiaceae bacterium]
SDAVSSAIELAVEDGGRPTLVCCKTVIGFGAPNKQGSASVHGAPLGNEEVTAARRNLGWDAPPFTVPDDIRNAWNATERGARAEQQWTGRFATYRATYPEEARELQRCMDGKLPATWKAGADDAVAGIVAAGKSMATRQASLAALNGFAPHLPELIGGSADLTGSNLTKHDLSTVISGSDASGNYLHFGVREFGMSAICNGISLHGGLIPYCGTFLTFSDYSRNALRMAALMKAQNIFVFTHDSIGLGEDGPTHQPVEHVASLRIMPNMRVWRPCDAVETAMAWRDAIERREGPTSLVLTRQSVPHQERSDEQLTAIRRGGYVLRDCEGSPAIVFIATGSEVGLAVAAATALNERGIACRVVSMPCTDLFDSQPEGYRSHVLPAKCRKRIVIEAGITELWWRFAGPAGRVIGLDRYGESAPAGELFEHFGFSVEHVLKVADDLINE